MDDIPMTTYTVTCTTNGCLNEGVAIEVQAATTDPIIMCGPCGNSVYDHNNEGA